MARIDFADELYVGVKARKAFDTKEFPLGFATPHGTDSASRKRRETVDNWVGGRFDYPVDPVTYKHQIDASGKRIVIDNGIYNGNVIKNEPLEGFQFERSVSRWSTSNKWFEINDPRGFTLQISAENLGEILLTAAIDQGKLKGRYVWGRAGGNNWLVPETHEDYIASKKPKEKAEIEIGDIISMGYSENMQYLGKVYLFEEYTKTEYFDSSTNTWSEQRTSYYSRSQQGRQVTVQQKDEKPWLIFAQSYEKSPGKPYLHFARAFSKKVEIKEKKAAIRWKLEFNKLLHGHREWKHDMTIAFETKEQVKAFNPATDLHKITCPTCNGTAKVMKKNVHNSSLQYEMQCEDCVKGFVVSVK